jgi:MFS family permease
MIAKSGGSVPQTSKIDVVLSERTSSVNFPFSPAKFPVFYGWFIMIVSMIGTIASIPGQTMGVGVFTDYLMNALHLSRNEISTAYMFGTITSSFLLPTAGKILDRFGARVFGVISAFGLGLASLFLAQTEWLVAALGSGNLVYAAAVVSVAFLLLRFFGQGSLTMVSRVMLGKWFNHRRGLATAISGVVVALGFAVAPFFLNNLVETFGWKGACGVLAVIVGAGMSTVAWIFYRDNPEQCGLTMDGLKSGKTHAQRTGRIAETVREFTRNEAIKTFSFWVFTLAVSTIALVITGATFHIASIGDEVGLSREEAYALFLPMGMFSIAANFMSGFLSDLIKHRWQVTAMMAAQFMSLLGLVFFELPVGRLLFVAGQGIAGGMFAALATVFLPRFFGRTHLGAISGVNFSTMVFMSAIGPISFSFGQSLTGSYQESFMACLAIPFVLMILSLWIRNPQESLV